MNRCSSDTLAIVRLLPIQIKDVPSLGSWKTESADGPCKMTTEYFVQDAELRLVDADELIKGYTGPSHSS